MLDANNHQGKFGQDYIRVLASAAGLLVYTPDLDYDGVDLLLRWPGRVGPAASPAIDVQVKSWSNPRKSDGTWHFAGLNEQQFNKLAGSAYTVPRYLFLVIVPKSSDTYSEVRTDGMLLRHQGFYLSLRDETVIRDPSRQSHRPVKVPVGNVLTVGSLRGLMDARLAAVGGAR
ncbi:MAG: DUF4365 domain-containing protein [Streptosporangiaceae bacterium]